MAQPCWRRRELPWEKRLLALRLSHIRRPKSSGQNPVVRGRHGISATSQSSTCENSRTARCKKHGNTLIGTLRKTYGPHFAKGCADDDKLSDVLHKLDEPSLSALVEDQKKKRRGCHRAGVRFCVGPGVPVFAAPRAEAGPRR